MTQPHATPRPTFAARITLGAFLVLLAVAGVFTPQAIAQTPPKVSTRGADLNIKQINHSVARAVQALYRAEPIYTFPPEYLYHHAYNQETRNMMGNHALGVWALLASGETYQNPPLYRRLNWVFSSDSPYVFDRGMRATMLAHLPRTRWAPWIKRDGKWLSEALSEEGDMGNYFDQYTGTKQKGLGDNANGQYGVLGLWHINNAGYTVGRDTWIKIDNYWRKAQTPTEGDLPAGWGVYSMDKVNKQQQLEFYTRQSGPMTGGAVAALCLTERYLYGQDMVDPGKNNISVNLKKGIRWLDENFSLDDKGEEADWFYYMWCMQRVGGATGYRTFNGVDWFRDVTGRIINQQLADGTWQGTQGRLISTSFALLYLSRANDPLAISKVRYKTVNKDGRLVDAKWNNRPHDIWNFVDYASDMYEISTIWQISELSQPVYELIESPILYLATDESFELRETEVNNLRDYLNAGGMLVINPESTTGEVLRSAQSLVAKLYPGKKLDTVPKDHPFFDVHQRLPLGINMMTIDNGIRPQVVYFTRDIGRDLQRNDRARGDGFVALSNVYLYVTGMNKGRTRLGSNYTVQRIEQPTTPIAAARIRHSGKFDPEPGALQQLKAILANDYNIDLQVAELDPKDLGNTRIAFLTTMGDAVFSDADAAAIRDWVAAGGTLWLDPAGGSEAASKDIDQVFKRIFPSSQLNPLPSRSPVISGANLSGGFDNTRVQYRWFALRTMGPRHTPRIQQVDLNGRAAVLYSTEDITCGLAGLDHWGIFGYTPQSARQLVINSVLEVARTPVATPTPAAAPVPAPAPEAEPETEPEPEATTEPAPAATPAPAPATTTP